MISKFQKMNKSKFKIEKNIPIPPRSEKWSQFPFKEMKVGDSFFVKKQQFTSTTLISLRALMWKKTKEYLIDQCSLEKFTFHTDRINQGVRVFKIQ